MPKSMYLVALLSAGISFSGIIDLYAQEKNKKHSIENFNASNVMELLNILPHESNPLNAEAIIIQNGLSNTTTVYLENDVLISHQQGNGNNIYYQDSQYSNPARMYISIFGENNTIEIVGSNSISDRMSVEISGHNKTLQMLNK
ncbi:hypothetical protein ACR79P_07565 [Sphingobacterium spiritivorum]|uniref:hypothetical protein n=1 Tax=Sphingobacterium spiritivorum TaxID=258 RepID=UPI003DA44D10